MSPVVTGTPLVGPADRDQVTPLVDRVRRRLLSDGAAVTPSSVAVAAREELGPGVGQQSLLAAVRTLTDELLGAGPLQALLAEPAVTDVLVNGPDEVWVDRGDGLVRTGVRFRSDDEVRRLAQRLASAAGRRLDDAQPWADAALPDGTRLHAVLPPVSPRPLLSLRAFRPRGFSLDDLVRTGSVTGEAAALLREVVRRRRAFLVTGGTGTGKTTVLGALLGLSSPADRLVLVEDAAELVVQHPHVVRLQTRPANLEGRGEVTLRDLVRQTLRMRPDRIVLGEVRGAEVVDLLAAMNTGHTGGCGTLHANHPRDVPARLEALGALAGLGREALHAQAVAALDVVVHLSRAPDGLRRLATVHRVDRDELGRLVMTEVWSAEGGRRYLPVQAEEGRRSASAAAAGRRCEPGWGEPG